MTARLQQNNGTCRSIFEILHHAIKIKRSAFAIEVAVSSDVLEVSVIELQAVNRISWVR